MMGIIMYVMCDSSANENVMIQLYYLDFLGHLVPANLGVLPGCKGVCNEIKYRLQFILERKIHVDI